MTPVSSDLLKRSASGAAIMGDSSRRRLGWSPSGPADLCGSSLSRIAATVAGVTKKSSIAEVGVGRREIGRWSSGRKTFAKYVANTFAESRGEAVRLPFSVSTSND